MSSFPAFIGYALAGVSYLVLAFLSAVGWRGARLGALFSLGVWSSAIWALCMVGISAGFLALLDAAPWVEWLRLVSWSSLLVMLSVPSLGRSEGGVPRLSGPSLFLSVATLCGFAVLCIGWSGLDWLSKDALRSFRYGSLLLIAIAGMVQVEWLFRSTEKENRWRVKFLCLGLGGLYAYDFVVYADALMYSALDPILWTARGGVNVLVVPLLAVAAARNRSWSIDIQVSRHVVLQSFTVLGSGFYLLLLAGAGYYLRYYGGNWGGIAQAIVLFGGGIVLVVLLASERLRSRLRVYISKNFFSYQFDYREQWLRFTDALARREDGQSIEKRAMVAIAELVESSRCVLWWLSEDNRFKVAAQRNMTLMKEAFTPEDSLIRFLQRTGWVVDLHACKENGMVYEDLTLPRALSADPEAWLIVPLFVEKDLLGLVLLGRSLGEVKVNWEVTDLLKVAGRQAANLIAQHRSERELAVAKQFESFNKMSAFVVHDLKNLVSQLALVLSNAQRLMHNPEFQQDMLATVANAVERIHRLLQQLQEAGTPTHQASLLDVAEVVKKSVQAVQPAYPWVGWRDLRADTGGRALANAERLERVLRHLLANAAQATESRPPADRCVELQIGMDGPQELFLDIQDNGIGMSAEFINDRLFRPFESTKTLGTGLGAYESREYIRAIGGDIVVNSEPGVGTVIRVRLPIAQSQAA